MSESRRYKCEGCGMARPCIVETNQEPSKISIPIEDLKCVLDETNQTGYRWVEINNSEAELQAKLLEQREACANKAKIKFSTAPDTYQQRVIDKDSILNATIEEG